MPLVYVAFSPVIFSYAFNCYNVQFVSFFLSKILLKIYCLFLNVCVYAFSCLGKYLSIYFVIAAGCFMFRIRSMLKLDFTFIFFHSYQLQIFKLYFYDKMLSQFVNLKYNNFLEIACPYNRIHEKNCRCSVFHNYN